MNEKLLKCYEKLQIPQKFWTYDKCKYFSSSPYASAECLRKEEENPSKLRQCKLMIDVNRQRRLTEDWDLNIENIETTWLNKNAFLGGCLRWEWVSQGVTLERNWTDQMDKEICDFEYDIYS